MKLIARTELHEIFTRLEAGEAVDGWGLALHKDFASLFNSSGGLWQRYHGHASWECVYAPTAAKLGAARPDIRVVHS